MKVKSRTKLADRILPNYTRGEENFNMITHIVGAGLGITYLVLCVIVSALHHSTVGVLSSIVYGVSVICLFTMSSLYHGLKAGMGKKVLQVLDHCTIYIMIAGTYTPITLCGLMKVNPVLAWVVFSVVWAIAAIAIVFTAIDLKKYSLFSMICYIAMGWCIFFTFVPAYKALTAKGFALLIIGGVFYTIGAVLYYLGKKKKYIHSVFHIFVDLGSIAHFLCILLYVL